MKADFYTKSVLTIIAVCLLVLVFRDLELIPKANASNSYRGYGLVPLNEDGSITVKLSNMETIDVNISRISTMDELDVNIDEVGGRSVMGSIPVNTE